MTTIYRESHKGIEKINNCSLCGNIYIEGKPNYCLNILCKNYTRPRIFKDFTKVTILDKSLHWSSIQRKDISLYGKIGTVSTYSNAEHCWYSCTVIIHNTDDPTKTEGFLIDDKFLVNNDD